MQEQPTKRVIFSTDAQAKLLEGAETVYKAVSSTLGPRSRNVAIWRPFGAPAVIHDGVKVARSLTPMHDREMEVGAEMILDAAEKTNNIGDGTTTATILAYEIYRAAHRNISNGARPMALREGIEQATTAVLAELDKLKKPIEARGKKTKDGYDVSKELLMIATISAQVPDIGQMVAEAYAELGPEGILTVEESGSSSSQLELKTGMQFDQGWINEYFITQGNRHGEAIIATNNDGPAYVLVTDIHLRDLEQFHEMLTRLVEGGVSNLVIIAPDFDMPVLSYFLKNHLKGAMRGLMVKAPSFGEKQTDMLRDIAIVTGAEFISGATGTGLQSVTVDMLGKAKRVVATQDTTLITEGAGGEAEIAARVDELKSKLEISDNSAFDNEKLKERIARMHSGVGILQIGANSEPEVKERIERAIDAISAAKAAITAGVVPGGGMSLKVAAAEVRKTSTVVDVDDDQRFGWRIVLDACEAPYNKLLTNSGYDPGEKTAEVRAAQKNDGPIMGVDVMDGQVVDLIKEGIIDPVMVVRAALANAASAAVMLATSDTLVTDEYNIQGGQQ